MKYISIIAALALLSCGNQTPAIAVASLGIAGAGLLGYCAAGGACSNSLLAYGTMVTREASSDAAILESGATTRVQIDQIVQNLTADIAQGAILQDLTAKQKQQVQAIASAAQSVIVLVETLTPKTVVVTKVKIPALTPKENMKLAEMRFAISKVK